jgi:hypothetical protein
MVIHADHNLSDDFRRREVCYRAAAAFYTFLAVVGLRSLYRCARQATSHFMFVFARSEVVVIPENPKGSGLTQRDSSMTDQPQIRRGQEWDISPNRFYLKYLSNGPARTSG